MDSARLNQEGRNSEGGERGRVHSQDALRHFIRGLERSPTGSSSVFPGVMAPDIDQIWT